VPRVKNIVTAASHAWTHRRASSEHRRALRCLGESLARQKALPEQAEIDRLQALCEQSLIDDRADYAVVPALARPLVVLRGLFARAVLRAREHEARKALHVAWEALAASALGDESISTPETIRARASFAEVERARAEKEHHPLPPALTKAGGEASHLAQSIARETKGALVPRLPALAGVGVGVWVANTFTDSSFSATLHSWGIGSGPRHAVTTQQYQLMHFWLPIVAAAICSYAGSRLAAMVRARYQRE
jgi:hypothetical protein